MGLLLVGCQGIASDGLSQLGLPLPVAELQGPPIAVEGIPQQQVGDAVTITGQVLQVAPLGSTWIYGVADATGIVWVLTETPPPAVGQSVRVTGQVQYETILLGGRDRGEHYLQEQNRAIVAASELEDSPGGEPPPAAAPGDSTPSGPTDAGGADASEVDPGDVAPSDADPSDANAEAGAATAQ
jgi:hypothetical protein